MGTSPRARDPKRSGGSTEDLRRGVGAAQRAPQLDCLPWQSGSRTPLRRTGSLDQCHGRLRIDLRLRDWIGDVGHTHAASRKASRQQPRLALGAATCRLDGRIIENGGARRVDRDIVARHRR